MAEEKCSRIVKVACPGQKPFELTYPTCQAADTARFRLSRAAKSCSVDLSGAGFGRPVRRRRKAKR